MIKQAAYGTEPWRLVEKEFNLDLLPQSESVFALSNGHIGLRGNLDEGDPHGLPGTYTSASRTAAPGPWEVSDDRSSCERRACPVPHGSHGVGWSPAG